jgi:hypothetical protein
VPAAANDVARTGVADLVWPECPLEVPWVAVVVPPKHVLKLIEKRVAVGYRLGEEVLARHQMSSNLSAVPRQHLALPGELVARRAKAGRSRCAPHQAIPRAT